MTRRWFSFMLPPPPFFGHCILNVLIVCGSGNVLQIEPDTLHHLREVVADIHAHHAALVQDTTEPPVGSVETQRGQLEKALESIKV